MGLWPFGKKEEKTEEKPIETTNPDGPACSLCGKAGADKRFAGQVFHKVCLRKARNQAKTMI